MKILALEFSSAQRSVALVETAVNGETQVLCSLSEFGLRHTPIFALIQQALEKADLSREQVECLVIGLGPGSYTGIRSALAVAQGWQLARGVKLLGISSAEVLAAEAQASGISGRIQVAIDAQRNEYYLAAYDLSGGWPRECEPLHLVSAAEVEHRLAQGEIVVGSDLELKFPAARSLYPTAEKLGKIAARKSDFVSGEKLEPIYLRETTFVKAPPARVIPDAGT